MTREQRKLPRWTGTQFMKILECVFEYPEIFALTLRSFAPLKNVRRDHHQSLSWGVERKGEVLMPARSRRSAVYCMAAEEDRQYCAWSHLGLHACNNGTA
jgi:hypothetical protein